MNGQTFSQNSHKWGNSHHEKMFRSIEDGLWLILWMGNSESPWYQALQDENCWMQTAQIIHQNTEYSSMHLIFISHRDFVQHFYAYAWHTKQLH